MYHVAICEDDAVIRADLTRRAGAVLTKNNTPHDITPFVSAEELETVMRSAAEPFDLLLLDIQLPGKNGVELGASLRALDDRVGIIFITSSAEYALAGYKARPSDYLLKPVSDAALAAALQTELKRHSKYQIVVFRERGRSIRLPASDILYAESRDHSTLIHTENETHTFSMPLTQAQELLPTGSFARCHNSYFVNLSRIRNASGKSVTLNNGIELPVGRAYRDEFHRIFIGHFF